MADCRICKNISIAMGKKFMMPLLGHKYQKITLEEIRPHLSGLNLDIVGGLSKRGWTLNDVDVVGTKSDIQNLSIRLETRGIRNPIHYCGARLNHSHIQCAYYGVKLALTGRGY
ncbi:hypothetical protein K8R03_00730 [Candidatus Kaiserbacteria bacterium]|nr:hypothetical protein [Candidatus Kaiserbacteria bacterium]